jgi:hypothetical protein
VTHAVIDTIALVGHVVAVLAVFLAAAAAARWAARRIRQPDVIAEIAVGLLAGVAIGAVGGPRAVTVLLPPDVLEHRMPRRQMTTMSSARFLSCLTA